LQDFPADEYQDDPDHDSFCFAKRGACLRACRCGTRLPTERSRDAERRFSPQAFMLS
jgi:hypothetical protein